MPSYRAERISQQIQHQVSILLEREIADPRLVGVNVTRVEVSGDLRNAKIFVAPNSEGEQATREMMAGLAHATGYFRRQIAENLDLRLAPEIRFLIDHAIEKGERFLHVLEELHTAEHVAEQTQSSSAKTKRRRMKGE